MAAESLRTKQDSILRAVTALVANVQYRQRPVHTRSSGSVSPSWRIELRRCKSVSELADSKDS